jgi:hypothetical protein
LSLQALPKWREGAERHYTPERALSAALDLVDWCRRHHSNTPVKQRLDEKVCNKPEERAKYYGILQYMKRSAAGHFPDSFPEAYAVLDEGFETMSWRISKYIHCAPRHADSLRDPIMIS